jgi:peptidoglycan/LPS O-acetylase OafA/YrhL
VSEFFQGKFSVKKYFINRFSRMWAVIIPALILGCIVDLQSLKLDSSLDFAHKITPQIFIGNIFFTQTIFFPSFGSNVPLWSLANEFWYYLIFPVFLLIGMGKWPKFARLIILVLFTAVLSYFMPHIMKLFPLWLLGILIRFIPDYPIFRNRYFFLGSVAALVLSTIYSNYTSTLFANYMVGIFFALTILCWMYRNSTVKPTVMKVVIDKVADFSFSLYAIHYFIIIYLIAILQQWGFGIRFKEANLLNWLLYLGIAFIILFISYVFYFLFERQTFKLRKLLNKLILRNIK